MSNLRVVIVEDEAVTARNLAHLLESVDRDINILNTLSSVSASVDWFTQNQQGCDLIFMDIRLADGLSFEIFKRVEISCPVIFVTAYNDYAITAFKNNGIDYILKPFDEQEVSKALQKFKMLFPHNITAAGNTSIDAVLQQINQLVKPYKRSFLVHYREKLIPVETLRIAWFYTANELVYARTTDERQYVMEFTMEQLEQQLNPQVFYRANRQFIVNRNAITEIDFFFNGRLLIKIKPEPDERILVSKARVSEFKSWMNS